MCHTAWPREKTKGNSICFDNNDNNKNNNNNNNDDLYSDVTQPRLK